MASALFNAIGRGYSARTILSSLARQSPKYASAIQNAYYYGYTANSILSQIASKKDGKNYDPEMFLTDFEKTQRNYQDQKRNRLLGTLAAAGTLGAIGAGLYTVIQKNKAIKPEVLMAEGVKKGKKGKKDPFTIHRERLQIENQQKQIANQQKQISHAQPPQPPQQKQGILPFFPPQQQQAQGQPPQPQGPQSQQGPQGPQGPAPQRPQAPAFNMKNVDLVNNLKEDSRFRNIISAGFDPDTTELALRATMPKDVLSIVDKTEGGLTQVIRDYSAFVKENPIKSAIEKNTEELQRQKQKQDFSQQEQQTHQIQQPKEAAEQVGEIQLPTNKNIQQAAQAQQMQEAAPQLSPQQKQPEPIAPVEQPQIKKPSPPVKPIVSLKNGKMGTLESIEKGVATINIDGNLVREKKNQLTIEGPEAETAARELVNAIPEGMKSTALMSAIYIPQHEMAVLKYWSGEAAWFSGLAEDDYMQIALGTYTPKGEAKTGIAEYNPSVADSHGAANQDLIVKNPRFSKENKGITWGYAKNEFDLLHGMQKHLTKISKERYDKEGNLITPKRKKK